MDLKTSRAIEFIDKYTKDEISTDSEITGRIDHINLKVASLESLEEVVTFLFENIQDIVPADRIAVSFFEENGRRLSIYYVKANYENLYLTKGYGADIKGSSLEKVFSEVTPRIINNLEEYLKNHATSDSTALLIKEGINSSITCPLSVEGRPVGLLFISSKIKNTYTREHPLLLMKLMERFGQAVEKTFRIEKLSEAINSYMEMLSFVSHELKSPLDSIISLGNTLSGGYFGKMDEKHRDYVLRMVSKAKYLREMTGEYLTLSRFESNQIDLNLSDIDFCENILEESIEIILPQIFEKNIKLKRNFPEGGAHLSCDATLMKVVVNNLLSNAVKYSNEDGIVELETTLTDEDLIFSVKNSGPGFPPEAKSKLFRKFSRIETGELMKRKGTGVGLYTSWKIINIHNGDITADSKEGEWAMFTFTIPRKQESKLKE
jgi:signal transduction histidine kinase